MASVRNRLSIRLQWVARAGQASHMHLAQLVVPGADSPLESRGGREVGRPELGRADGSLVCMNEIVVFCH